MITHDGDSLVAFCQESPCLKADMEASRAKARIKREASHEKSSEGVVISGAERYRLGSLYHQASIAEWMAAEDQTKIVKAWLTNKQPFLIVQGVPGTGKTYLSAAVLNHLFAKKQEVAYTTHRRFIESLHAGMKTEETQHHTISKIAYKQFLVFDDLGAATNTEWQQEMLLELIDLRYSRRSKTVFTTNLTDQEIKTKLGERTYSRLFDKGNAFIEFWNAEDKRTSTQKRVINLYEN